MANQPACSKKAFSSLSAMTVRVAGLTLLPVLLPATWVGPTGSAWAACTEPSTDSYVCSGSSAGETISSSSGPLTIEADSSLNINNGAGAGIDITSSHGSSTFSQASAGTITGTTGIDARQFGPGSSSITIAGDVTGTDDYAVFAYSDSTAGDVTVEQTAGTITGISHGIRVDNYGSGSATITTAGTVSQSNNTHWDTYGVYAYNASTATDITLTQTSGAISGHYYGLYGNNQGTGSTTINVAGDVTATGRAGVAGYNGNQAKDINISQTAGTITSNDTGILADNAGTGSTHVSTSSDINAAVYGVFASNGGDASDLSVTQNAGTITGDVYGILASNAGSGDTFVTVNGEVHGDTGAGIFTAAANGATVNIAPTATVSSSSGFAIQNIGAGAVVVTSAGQINGDASLGPADDTFNLTGGAYTGSIFGDNRDDPQSSDGLVNNEGNDTFAWTGGTLAGGFFGQDGSDTAMVNASSYDGTQVLDGGDDTSIADGMVDTLSLTGVSATSAGANLTNWETVRLDGAKLAISDGAWKAGMPDEDGTGIFLSNGATLDGMTALALDSRLALDATSSFVARGGGSGVYAVSGSVNNAGTINMQDGAAGDVMTIAGNYTGANGSLQVDTVLGDDGAGTDRLLIGGDTSGDTRLLVNNVGGTGAPTREGIRVIGVDGQSAGRFTLAGDYTVNDQPAMVAGAYAYQLHQGGVSTPDDGDWYLRSQLNPTPEPTAPATPLYQAGVPTYEAYPHALLALNGLPTLQQRVGNRYWAGAGAGSTGRPQAAADGTGIVIEGNGLWGRMEGAYNRIKPHSSTSDTRYDQDIFRMQIGVDKRLKESEDGKLIGGVSVHYAHGKTNTQSPHGDGDIHTDGYGIGGTLTWYGNNGFYLDGQAQASWYDSDLDARLARRSLTQGNDGFGYAASIEGGRRVALDDAWSITPQAQLMYSNVDFDSFTDPFGARVSNGHGESLQGRLGIALNHESSRGKADGSPVRRHVYGLANLHYEFLGASKVNVAGASFASRSDPLWASVGVGGSYNWSDDKYSIYGEGLVGTSLNHFGDSYSLAARVGFRMRW